MDIAVIETRLTGTQFNGQLEQFLNYLSNKGRKDTTIRTYREALRSLHRVWGDDLMDITPAGVAQLKDMLCVCETSKKTYLVILGRFLEVSGRENAVKKADILWNKAEQRRLFITPDEFRVMMTMCDARERLVLALGAYMGLRRSEIIGLRFSDITYGIVTVHGKGHGREGKVAHIKAPKPVMNMLKAYLRVRPKVANDYVLLTTNGRRMSSERLGVLIKKAGRRCGVELTPHSLRRLFACTLNDVGTDLDTIRRLMRHESITTTVSCYLNANPAKSDNAVEMLCRALS